MNLTLLKTCSVFLTGGLFIISSCAIQKRAVLRDPVRVDSSLAVIKFQTRNVYDFNNGTIHFSNRFATARLNSIKQENDSTFSVDVLPENTPVNPSPWYAFKIWTSVPDKNIVLKLNYTGTVHRYDPRTSHDGLKWTEPLAVKLSPDKKKAVFNIKTSSDTLTIAAQEIISSAMCAAWTDSLAALPFVQKLNIGKSLLGKPLYALTTTGSAGKKMVVVLSRQHPPEVTGYMAMQEFVRTATASTPLALAFRKKYELVIVPMMNPDGVDEGNWRHSVAGVDLNRDWTDFKQPETRAVRDFLISKVKKQDGKVYFGLDFHSTYNDVFYTNEDLAGAPTNIPGFTAKWLNAFESAIPGFKASVKPSPNGGNVSKSWMGRELKAEALTYEVGDKTSRSDLRMKGRLAAEKMMELLLGNKD